MKTLDPSRLVRPFAKINYWPDGAGGATRVRCCLLVERPFENSRTGLAIDGSASMRPAFGYPAGLFGALLSFRPTGANLVRLEARRICEYLARSLDVEGKAAVIYWGTGPRSERIEVVGDLSAAEALTHEFRGPRAFGGGQTALLPAVRYFVERFSTSAWGMYVFLTDGVIADLAATKEYCRHLADAIAKGRRPPLKLILIGVGSQIDEDQMIELDDLETGTAVDLWDHRIARDLNELAELFAEVVDESVILADSGVIRDSRQRLVRHYRDGLPALLEFDLPRDAADEFLLEIGGETFRQPLNI